MEERLRTLERDVALNKQDIDKVEKNSKNWWSTMRDDVEDIKAKLDRLPDEIINRLKMYSASLGQIVRVITPDSEYDAKVLDIAPDGGLVILSDGETKTITSGEIVHIR